MVLKHNAVNPEKMFEKCVSVTFYQYLFNTFNVSILIIMKSIIYVLILILAWSMIRTC